MNDDDKNETKRKEDLRIFFSKKQTTLFVSLGRIFEEIFTF